MRPDAKVEKVYLYPKPVDFRKSIDGLAALVELDIKYAIHKPHLPSGGATVYRSICGEQFHGSSAS
ncbi:IS66 family insertion sequence element accessory protein TnpB [Pseudomonas protegens]|uniref:IS66 family insertion sequence element accessory protein TnpB n=1 Tax=Pseudomonas protegens TaxID=380021 RepID=UPI00391C5CE7